MASSTEICNLALSHLGIAKPIANLSTEQSQEASACRVFYEITRDTVLKDYPWPFCTKIAAIALVEEDPNVEWQYSYRYPSDCLAVRKILSGVRNETSSERIPYKISSDSQGLLIFSDLEEAEMEYTVKITDANLYSTDFILAFSFRLASYLAPRLTAGDPFKLADRMLQMYRLEMSKATANAFNEEQRDPTPDPELIQERN